MKYIRNTFLVLLAGLMFVSCEKDDDKSNTPVNKSLTATYSYLGEMTPVEDLLSMPEEEYSWTLEGNTLIIDRKKTVWDFPTSAQTLKVYVEMLGDTIFVIEKCYDSYECNTPHTRDSKLTLSNMPQGEWTVVNTLEFPFYRTLPTLPPPGLGSYSPYVDLRSYNAFRIEVK